MLRSFCVSQAFLLLAGFGVGIPSLAENPDRANERAVRSLDLPAWEVWIHVDRARGATLREIMNDIYRFSGGRLAYKFDPERIAAQRLEEFHVGGESIEKALLALAKAAHLRFAIVSEGDRRFLVVSLRDSDERSRGDQRGAPGDRPSEAVSEGGRTPGTGG